MNALMNPIRNRPPEDLTIAGVGTVVESWSGYALDRCGDAVVP